MAGGAKITASDDFSAAANNNGSTVNGAAIAVSPHSTNLPIIVRIYNAELDGAYSVYEKNFQSDRTAGTLLEIHDGTFNAPVYSENIDGFISGGKFAAGIEVPAEYLAAGCSIDAEGNVVVM